MNRLDNAVRQTVSNGHPYFMWSGLFTAPIAANTVLTPGERVMRNTTPDWLRVHAIGFGAVKKTANVEENETAFGVNASGYRPEWSIRFGSTTVTNGMVPIAATTWAPYGDEYSGAMVAFNRPVYLAPNDRIDVKIRFRNTPAATMYPFIFARCSPVARPDAIRIPVIYGWEKSSVISGNLGEFNEDVPVGTFYNEFAETVHVERMLGRLSLYPWRIPASYGASVLVDLELHDGTKITRAPTPMSSLFDLARQSWVMRFDLPSKGYIKANVSGTIGSGATTYYPYLGLIGYRTIG